MNPRLPQYPHYRFARVLCLTGAALWAASGQAQTAITTWSLSSSDASDVNRYNNAITFDQTTYAITSFATAGENYTLGATASNVYVRRNTDSSGNGTHNQAGIDNNNRTTLWHTQDGSDTRLLGTYQDNLGSVLLNNNAIMGVGNLFVNSANTNTTNAANVERVDFYFGAQTVHANQGLTIFDRGNAGPLNGGHHDYVSIAVFTGWNSTTAAPTTYGGNVVSMTPDDYGSNLDWNPNAAGVQSTFEFSLLRFGAGDALTSLNGFGNPDVQGVAGAFISFADLGIATGTTIYGYSIMASDVTTNVGQLANWNNATYYPTGTNDLAGGIDLMSFNGRIARPVPEPATYGALLLGGCVGVWWLRRRRMLNARAV